tara:strand:+ start:1409 stop:1645 length:237 start_codon:yes stop_codon:yes gene_type:complete
MTEETFHYHFDRQSNDALVESYVTHCAIADQWESDDQFNWQFDCRDLLGDYVVINTPLNIQELARYELRNEINRMFMS